MRLGRRVEIQPTPLQLQKLKQAAGNARWAWNWGLRRKITAWAARKAALEVGTPPSDAPNIPSAIDLHRELNALKRQPAEVGGVPWMYLATKCAPQEALRALDTAFQHFFRRLKTGEKPGFPRFKTRHGGRGGFRVTGTVLSSKKTIQIPTIGALRIKPGCHGYIPVGKHGQASVRECGGRWYVAVLGPDALEAPLNGLPVVGADLGVVNLATLSTGEVIDNPRAYKRAARKVKRAQQAVSRCKKGSHRRMKAKARLGRARRREHNVRQNAIHQATSRIAKSHGTVVIEDLRIRNMTRRCKGRGRAAKAGLNRSILDAGFYEFRRQLEYKCKLYGAQLVIVDPKYTSQRCSRCGHVARENRPSQAVFSCVVCGHEANADLNAAQNILVAGSCPETQNARGRDVRPVSATAGTGSSGEARIGSSTKVTPQ